MKKLLNLPILRAPVLGILAVISIATRQSDAGEKAAPAAAATCARMIEKLQIETGDWSLGPLLARRPHRFSPPLANESELVALPSRFVWPKPKTESSNLRVHREVYDSLVDLLTSAQKAGIALRVHSAYRSPQTQARIWKKSFARTHDAFVTSYRVAPPCYSEHATGRAVDLVLAKPRRPVAGTRAERWLKSHASEKGWSLSFKAGASEVSTNPSKPGIMPEPWHYHHDSLEPPTETINPTVVGFRGE